MSIKIEIKDQDSVATVQVVENNIAKTKQVTLESLLSLFNSLVGTKKDTGYLNSNLLREESNKISKRAFLFKEFITDFKVRKTLILHIKADNKYGFKYEKDGLGDRDYLLIPGFTYRDIIGVICNSNTQAFNPSYYQIFCAHPNMFGTFDDNTKLTRFFPNQFNDHICWPNGFNKDILSNKDPVVQSSFITQYLSSKFNSDLFYYKFRNAKLSPFMEEFNTFAFEVFDIHEDYKDSAFSYLQSESQHVASFVMYYFLSNIKNINPATLCDTMSMTLGGFFKEEMFRRS